MFPEGLLDENGDVPPVFRMGVIDDGNEDKDANKDTF